MKAELEWTVFHIVIKKLRQPEYNENIPTYGMIRQISTKHTIIKIISHPDWTLTVLLEDMIIIIIINV